MLKQAFNFGEKYTFHEFKFHVNIIILTILSIKIYNNLNCHFISHGRISYIVFNSLRFNFKLFFYNKCFTIKRITLKM